MSINTNHAGLPDEATLQQLANSFFKALPGSLNNNNVQDNSTQTNLGNTVDNNDQIKPVANEHNSELNLSPAKPLITEHPTSAGIGSTATGSGQQNAFNIDKPQTHLPDPHFDKNSNLNGAGSGISPSFFQHGFHFNELPFADGLAAYSDLSSILPQKNQAERAAQLPLPVSNNDKQLYYFLSGAEQSPFRGEDAKKQSFLEENSFSALSFDVNLIKKDFPILQERVNGRPLVWLDNAATTQKPRQVIDRINYFYEHENSNIHRAAHALAARATDAYEEARKKVQNFINAGSPNEVVFVRGTTEAINLVAKSWGEQHLQAGDEIIISHLEHHANIVPWQQLAVKKGVIIRVIPVDDDGQIIIEEYVKLLSPKTRLVSFTQVSNALGTITPAKRIIELAHQVGAKVLVDGAQSISHIKIDVKALNCDWFVFSGHKLYAPTGIGVLYGKEDLLNETQPWQGGGNMIQDVTFERTIYQKAPNKFEAGTDNIADAVGLGAAIDYINNIGIDLISQYEHYLLVYATKLMKEVRGLRLIGTAAEKASVLSFVLNGYTNDEVGQALNKEGIAVRTGHHCAQPILRRFGLESSVRPSLAFYNTCQDIDKLVSVLHNLQNKKSHRQVI